MSWYYTRDGKTKNGPISSDDLQALAKAGRVLPTDMVMKDGTGKWAPASKVKGLFAQSRPVPTPQIVVAQVAPPMPENAPPPTQSPPENTAIIPPRKWHQRRWVRWSAAAFVVVYLIGKIDAPKSSGPSSRPSQSSTPQAATPPPASRTPLDVLKETKREQFISAQDLHSEFNTNEVAANAKYKGKAIFVIGNVDNVRQHDLSLGPFTKVITIINLEGRHGGTSIICKLSKSAAESGQLTQLRPKELVRVHGTCTGQTFLGGIELDECVFQVGNFSSAVGSGGGSIEGQALAAFRKVVQKYKQIPDRLASTAEQERFTKELQAIQEEFYRVPFDPKVNRQEAKAIVELYERELEGRYRGEQARLLGIHMSGIVMKLIE